MNKFITIFLLLFPTLVFAGDYACYDENGVITKKVYSKGAVYSYRDDCVLVDRATLQSATKYYTVNNGTITEMSQGEKDAVDAAQAAAIKESLDAQISLFDSKVGSTYPNSIALTMVNNKIDNIGSLADTKEFLRKLVRGIYELHH